MSMPAMKGIMRSLGFLGARACKKPREASDSVKLQGAFAGVMLLAIGVITIQLASGQTPSVTKAWTPPRTADGQPDLEGVWTNATITPLERPVDLAGKAFFTLAEV